MWTQKRKSPLYIVIDILTAEPMYGGSVSKRHHLPNQTKPYNYYSFDKETQVSQQRHLPQHVVVCVTSFLFLVSFPSLFLLQSLENSRTFPLLSP